MALTLASLLVLLLAASLVQSLRMAPVRTALGEAFEGVDRERVKVVDREEQVRISRG